MNARFSSTAKITVALIPDSKIVASHSGMWFSTSGTVPGGGDRRATRGPIKRLIQEVPPDKAVNRGTVANPDVGQGPGVVPFWCEMTGSG